MSIATAPQQKIADRERAGHTHADQQSPTDQQDHLVDGNPQRMTAGELLKMPRGQERRELVEGDLAQSTVQDHQPTNLSMKNLRMQRLNRVGPLVCLLLLSSPLAAQEWTRFRGPNGQGIANPEAASTIPTRFTNANYNWKTKLPGKGHGSPTLWGDRLFVMSGDPQTGRRYVLCLDAKSGEIKWKKDFTSNPHHVHGLNSYGSCTPALDAERLYICWGTPTESVLLALTQDGELVWKRDLSPFVSQHGYGTSPMVYGDLVILAHFQQGIRLGPGQTPGKSSIIAVDGATGKTCWESSRKSTRAGYGVPCVRQDAKGIDELICTSHAHGIEAFDPKSGDMLWNAGVFELRTCSSPVLAGKLILGTCGSGGGGNYIVALRPPVQPGNNKAEVAYTVDRQAPYVPTPVLGPQGKYIYCVYDKGIVQCVDAATGNVTWRARVGGGYYGSPVLVGDRIYCLSLEGECIVFQASPEQFTLLARNDLGESSSATPAIARGRMYLRTESHVLSVGGK